MRDTSAMLFLAAPVGAAVIALSSVTTTRHAHHHHKVAHAQINSRHIGIAEEKLLRRRVARMTRLALLQRREALLHDFLIQVNTESPLLRDNQIYRFESGIAIGPSQVTRDFLGSPIIRAHVTNLKQTPVFVLLEALVTSADGSHERAMAAVTLQPGAARTIELLCPGKVAPASMIWNAMPL